MCIFAIGNFIEKCSFQPRKSFEKCKRGQVWQGYATRRMSVKGESMELALEGQKHRLPGAIQSPAGGL